MEAPTIATYNVDLLAPQGGIRMRAIMDTLEGHNPDIVALQEVATPPMIAAVEARGAPNYFIARSKNTGASHPLFSYFPSMVTLMAAAATSSLPLAVAGALIMPKISVNVIKTLMLPSSICRSWDHTALTTLLSKKRYQGATVLRTHVFHKLRSSKPMEWLGARPGYMIVSGITYQKKVEKIVNLHLTTNAAATGDQIKILLSDPLLKGPAYIIGDFNNVPNSGALKLLTDAGFRLITSDIGPTYHGDGHPGAKQIDHIFVRGHEAKKWRASTDASAPKADSLSDHFLVLATPS